MSKVIAPLSAKIKCKRQSKLIGMVPATVRRLVGRARVGHFATSDGERPSVVPVCFVLVGETVYHAIDAKAKMVPAGRLRRVANLQINSNAALLVDHFEEDWAHLWYALLRGRARLIAAGEEQRRAIRALRRKYAQYRTTLPLAQTALVIALDVEQVTQWVSAPRGRTGAPAGRRA